ncbi:MAG: trehalose-phosphatase [Deltaproteobacteria bacterium]|nr:trehalose-phosphatase [Deltaproteobacteria bacterium]MDQ3295357.1 trehalose-phosphatase [Myxococcota bacterium]
MYTNLAFSLPDSARWRELACYHGLSLLLDLDGALVELAATPEQATLDDATVAAIQQAIDGGIHVVIVSGRPRATIEPLVDRLIGAWWFAEHGAWQLIRGVWTGPAERSAELDDLATTLAELACVQPARTEHKSHAVCIHWRGVDHADRISLMAAAELACDEWLETHQDFERVAGLESLEVRRRNITRGIAVRRVREHLPPARIIAIGADVSDEDMFAELVDGDVGASVGDHRRRTLAHASLAGPHAVLELVRWLTSCRAGASDLGPPPVGPVVELQPARERTFVTISNRTPSVATGRGREVGGLVSALEPALRSRQGIWLGWSGHERDGKETLAIDALAEPPRASFDLSRVWREKFYGGFCNRTLWPLFHSFPMRTRYDDADWKAYVEANEAYARHAVALARPDATIWVHDYHLLLVARELRRLGHRGPIGFFLHIPFPPYELFETMPWQAELVDGLLDYDLVGFHTERWAGHFVDVARRQPATSVTASTITQGTRRTVVGVFPVPIDATAFTPDGPECSDVSGLRAQLGDRRLLLGVDRLDYSKGIPERLAAFERLLESYPEWRRRVSFVQVSVPSRAELADYAELRQRIETMVGRINGKFGEADWIPVRYLYRSYDHTVLAQLYRLASVAVVTPLRDGMNLVAKEFVAAQDAESPGVLVLSRFAGAATQLTDAVITNPFHPDGLAADLDRALRMPLTERVTRHARLHAVVTSENPCSWSSAFLDALAMAALERKLPTDMPSIQSVPLELDQLS